MCMEHQTFFLNPESTNEWGSDDVKKKKQNHKFASENNNLIPQEPVLL